MGEAGRHSSRANLPAQPDDATARRARWLFAALAGGYALLVVGLYAFDLFGFFWKTVIVPSLFIFAYLAGRFRAFVRDWAVFLGAVVLFDTARGLVHGLILRFELPVYMGYAIDLEQALFGSPVATLRLQRVLFAGDVSWFDKLLVMVHASHFLVFLLVGLFLWLREPQVFARFKVAMLLVMYVGVTIYLLVPTVPPWMAANRYFVLDPIAQIARRTYNLSVPSMFESFDINPIAAMPSLHAAFPTVLALACLSRFRGVGIGVALYTLTAQFGIVYMGEHYVVDVLAGLLLAGLAWWLTPPLQRRLARATPDNPAGAPAAPSLKRPLLISALLLIAAQLTGVTAHALQGRQNPTADFIERELAGKSPMASYYRGLNAYYAGDHEQAQAHFASARFEVPDPSKRERARLLYAETAFRNGDFAATARTLTELPQLSPEQALMLAEAQLRLGKHALGFQVLDILARSLPADPTVAREKRRLEREFGRAAPR